MLEILVILIITAFACAVIGVFAVLRNIAMISDAISHSILLGIVVAYMITQNIDSPFLFIGAAVMGIITVYSTELILKFSKMKEDSAIGIIFPLFFSLGVILLSKFLSKTHLCVDTVIMGEVLMAPFRRTNFLGIDMSVSMRNLSLVFMLNIFFILIFYKELKASTFDREFAKISGISILLINYLIATLVSITAVAAFDAVGTILVISFLIAPAASAYLVCKRLSRMILFSLVYAFFNTLIGFLIAIKINLNISGMICFVSGLSFFLTVLLNKNGIITGILRRIAQRHKIQLEMLLMHIANHEGKQNENDELGIESIYRHVNWNKSKINNKIKILTKKGLIKTDLSGQVYRLTDKGKDSLQQICDFYWSLNKTQLRITYCNNFAFFISKPIR